MKENIINTVKDLCADFLYYDRKEDEELSADDLIQAIEEGTVTIEEMVAEFENQLRNTLQKYVKEVL
jgi:predicted RNA-binding protein associated with RNAse of E/G family